MFHEMIFGLVCLGWWFGRYRHLRCLSRAFYCQCDVGWSQTMVASTSTLVALFAWRMCIFWAVVCGFLQFIGKGVSCINCRVSIRVDLLVWWFSMILWGSCCWWITEAPQSEPSESWSECRKTSSWNVSTLRGVSWTFYSVHCRRNRIGSSNFRGYG